MNRQMRRASEANGRSLIKRGWNPFEDFTAEAFTRSSFATMTFPPCQVFKNNIYIVQIWLPENTEWGKITKTGIRRNDAAPVHSWSDLFRIKNEIFGEDRFAIEVFPSVNELVDVANMYWLFVLDVGARPSFSIRRN